MKTYRYVCGDCHLNEQLTITAMSDHWRSDCSPEDNQ